MRSDSLWQGLTTDAASAEQTLAQAPSGLVPAWKNAVSEIKKTGVSSFLAPETENLSRIAPRVSEFQLERRNRLIDLLG